MLLGILTWEYVETELPASNGHSRHCSSSFSPGGCHSGRTHISLTYCGLLPTIFWPEWNQTLLWLCAGTLRLLDVWTDWVRHLHSYISQIPQKYSYCSIDITVMFIMCEDVRADVQVKFPHRIRGGLCLTDQPFSAHWRHVWHCLWCQYIFISNTEGLGGVDLRFAYKASSLFLDWVWRK